MDECRISFAKDRIKNYQKGDSGITATSDAGSRTFGKPEMYQDGTYSSSQLLFDNIDKLGESMQQQQHKQNVEPEKVENTTSSLDNLTENEVIENLDFHLGLTPRKKTIVSHQIAMPNTEKDNFCRNCGIKYSGHDNFCANCGFKRN